MSWASRNPSTTPVIEPVAPSRSAPLKTKRLSWSRVAPAARRSPTSRARSPTVMVKVLTMRNAPTNRTIAATRAAVDWKALDDARRLLAMSPGDDRTYGSVIRASRRAVTAVSESGASWTSTLVAPARSKVARATSIGITRVRPEPASGPKPGRIPMTRRSCVPSAPRSVSLLPRP